MWEYTSYCGVAQKTVKYGERINLTAVKVRVSGVHHPFRHIKPGSREAKTHLRINIKNLALTIIYAALYMALVVAFSPISFVVAQFRIAGALRPAIANKRALSVGYGLGALAGNFFSSFAGPWDLVFIPIARALERWT